MINDNVQIDKVTTENKSSEKNFNRINASQTCTVQKSMNLSMLFIFNLTLPEHFIYHYVQLNYCFIC